MPVRHVAAPQRTPSRTATLVQISHAFPSPNPARSVPSGPMAVILAMLIAAVVHLRGT
ncbi:hypothetical protein PGTUg99_034070 [Puccinia graminis f. sp. tritici]|uniref:Uncharacterized protein n=1 Tax=Puccinia graminis f. sp. tritici TaxID=56615 RepID=A0A5B0NJR6_PUCGR|nr:hypothetical protein PGTUg99_034070 [Puccinia graminis f. sp. tritici]